MPSENIAELLLGLVETLRENSAQDPIDFLILEVPSLPTVARAGLVLTDAGGGPVAAYGSDDHARRLVERRDGPAFDCMRSGEPALFGTGYVHPLLCDGQTLGVLAIVADPPPADADHARLGKTLADAAAMVVVIRRETDRTRAVAAQLQTALTTRIGIEQAKGVIAGRLGIGVDEAFQILRQYARSNNRRLAEIAEEVVSGQVDPAVIRGRVLARSRGPAPKEGSGSSPAGKAAAADRAS
jgi:ANTAR domain-containing protein